MLRVQMEKYTDIDMKQPLCRGKTECALQEGQMWQGSKKERNKELGCNLLSVKQAEEIQKVIGIICWAQQEGLGWKYRFGSHQQQKVGAGEYMKGKKQKVKK